MDNSIKRKIEIVGYYIMAIAFLIGIIFILGLFIKGGVWVADLSLPIFRFISYTIFLVDIIIFLPLLAVKKFKRFSGSGLLISSYLFGITLWLWCLVLTFKLWGWLALVIGVVLCGIGVVPIALLAALFSGLFSTFCWIILYIIIVFATRVFGIHLINQSYFYDLDNPPDTSGFNNDDDIIDVNANTVDKEE